MYIKVSLKNTLLEVIENKHTIFAVPIRIGKPSTPTPIGMGIIYIKRNPAIFRYVDPGPDQGKIIHEVECDGGRKYHLNYHKIRALGFKK